MKRLIRASREFVDMGTGLKYWYFTTHGVQPGSIPRGLNILEIRDTPNGTYFLTDKVITTDALKWYDIKERSPEIVESNSKVAVGDIIEWDSNYSGVTPRIHKGKILQISKAIATHGDSNPSKIYKVKDELGRVYKIDEAAIL